MKMSEDEIQQMIRAEASANGMGMWRNNNGALPDMTGRPVRFGLGNDSKKINETLKSSDLIGCLPVVITQEMVGQVVGIFVACEVKEENWTFNPNDKHEVAQLNYINLVKSKGGKAGFANSIDDFKKIIGR